jgi:hypothetical protein
MKCKTVLWLSVLVFTKSLFWVQVNEKQKILKHLVLHVSIPTVLSFNIYLYQPSILKDRTPKMSNVDQAPNSSYNQRSLASTYLDIH